jgi:hypothetical protein
MDYALADKAVATKSAGGMQIEMAELPAGTICWLTPAAAAKITSFDGRINENYVLPGPNGLQVTPVNMAAYYARFGTIEFIPAFSEYLEVPMGWFLQPADRVVDFVATVTGLTMRERVEFSAIVALCHNIARYERITKRSAPINRDQYVRTLLHLDPNTIINP